MAALSEEQTLIRDQAQAWVRDQAPVAAFRAMRDADIEIGFDPKIWQDVIDMGWTGILIPEQYGGSDLGYLTFGIVLEELGRHLVASPLFASAYVGATALLLSGDQTQQQAHLPKIVDGSEIITLAIDEGPHHRPERTASVATPIEAGFALSGTKTFVPEALSASHFIVVARTSGIPGNSEGISLFLIPSDSAGVHCRRMHTIDSRGYGEVIFDNVTVPQSACLGQIDQGFEILEVVLDRARAGLGMDMLGTASQAFDMTLEYLKTRKQFGQVIGSFQALGHRAAGLFTNQELSRSCAEAALQAIDDKSNNVAARASLSQAKVGTFLHDMSNQLIQIHGGIGMTDEFDAGLYLKRARVLETLYGSPAYHRDRYARLHGF